MGRLNALWILRLLVLVAAILFVLYLANILPGFFEGRNQLIDELLP